MEEKFSAATGGRAFDSDIEMEIDGIHVEVAVGIGVWNVSEHKSSIQAFVQHCHQQWPRRQRLRLSLEHTGTIIDGTDIAPRLSADYLVLG